MISTSGRLVLLHTSREKKTKRVRTGMVVAFPLGN
jgi:hypothetical protein